MRIFTKSSGTNSVPHAGSLTRTQSINNGHLAKLSLAALGVVFGDISTSPIYALRECFHGEYGIAATPLNVYGILSLVFWALIIIVSFKYMVFVFRADNRGEGGVLALTALIRGQDAFFRRGKGMGLMVAAGLFAACLLYGDGMITPAISVLSAVEGIRIITPVFTPYALPITIAILCGLFLTQRRGTAKIGSLFGPVITVWLLFLAVTGLVQIAREPSILKAVFPWHGIAFFLHNKWQGFVVLGAVFLVATGTEALYADMGHFGKKPIRLTWFTIVLPSLLLNYFGQGALLLNRPEETPHPFFAMVPFWAIIPAVLLATLATIIASQAVISGAFSLTHQAIQLGYLPRLKIRHTSAAQIGQIYVGPVNWMLMVTTIALVFGFKESSRLAAAYGVAVTSTMLITTFLFYVATRERWHWRLVWAVPMTGLFLLVDTPFFLANIIKITHGAWFPLVIAAFFFMLMLTWSTGRRILVEQLRQLLPPMHQFLVGLASNPPARIQGHAVFLTGNPGTVPVALAKNVKHNRIVHRRTVLLHFRVEDVPRIPSLEKVKVDKLGKGFYRMTVRYGYMEHANLAAAITLARSQGLELDPQSITYFIGRENLVSARRTRMGRLSAGLFIFMSRNAADAASFFNLPADKVVEMGIKLEV
jgi:KUP system potassium uptake protein